MHIYVSSIGLGQHIDSLPPEDTMQIVKVLWASYWLGDLGISLPKASVLFFYARVFTTQNRGFKIALWIGQILNLLWWLTAIARVCLFCTPVQKYWEGALVEGVCRNADSLYIGSAVPSVILDLYILLLPLPMMARLNLKPGRKILLMGVFILGYA